MADLTDELFGMDTGIDETVIEESISDLTALQGDGNSPGVVSDTSGQTSSSPLQLLGSVGSTARDLGTAVGTLQRDLKNAGKNFSNARNAAANGNSLSTWWQYASTTDKMMVGLAALAILVALKD